MSGTELSTLIPEQSPPLTRSVAIPAIEYSLRATFCGLRLAPWPPTGSEYTFLNAGTSSVGLAPLAVDAALDAARRRRLRLTIELRRIVAASDERAAACLRDAQALKSGREQSDIESRTESDLAATAQRLREALYAAWAGDTRVALAACLGASGTTVETVCESMSALGPVAMWGVEPSRADLDEGRRVFGDAWRLTCSEIVVVVDELASRWAQAGKLSEQGDVAYLEWDELAQVQRGALAGEQVGERVSERRLAAHVPVAGPDLR